MNNGILRVIKEGTSLVGDRNLNDSMFLIWLDYSRKMLDLVCRDSFVKYQYSTFAFQVMNSQLPAYEKLSKCVEYLIKMAPMMS